MEHIRHSINMCCCLRFTLTKLPSKHFPSIVSFTVSSISPQTEPGNPSLFENAYFCEHWALRMCHIWYWALYMHFLIQLEDNTVRYITLFSSSFCIWWISRVTQKINELPRLHRQWVVKVSSDPRQWDSRAPRIAIPPGVVADLCPGFNCISDVTNYVTSGQPLQFN